VPVLLFCLTYVHIYIYIYIYIYLTNLELTLIVSCSLANNSALSSYRSRVIELQVDKLVGIFQSLSHPILGWKVEVQQLTLTGLGQRRAQLVI